jgi:hypothetical protein
MNINIPVQCIRAVNPVVCSLLRIAMALAVVTLQLACSFDTPAAAVLKQYTTQTVCADRAKFTVDGEKDRPRIEAFYASQGTCAFKGTVDTKECDQVSVGRYCTGILKTDKGTKKYCLLRTAEREFKVDFGCTVGWNDPSLAIIKTTKLDEAVPVRGNATLWGVFSGDFQDQSRWYGVTLHGAVGRVVGYFRRTTPAGAELLAVLKDGAEHPITVLVAHPLRAKSLDEVEILQLVHEGWQPLSEKESADAKALYAEYVLGSLRE